jgi:hypothetical protein
MNFDTVADGLYGLAPNLFVSERTAAEKQARIDGDRELAGRIHQLTKPTTVGWLANQLVRGHPEEIGPLLELGAGLREATANLSREKLQELMRLQHQVIAGLIKQARLIARDANQRIGEDAVRGLEDTLRAALADESLGQQLLKGQLTGALHHDGFPGAAPGVSRPSPAKSAAKKPAPDSRIAEAEQAVTEAKANVKASDEARLKAQQKLTEATTARSELSQRVKQLQADLEKTSHQHDQAERTEREARQSADVHDQEAERAGQRLDQAVAKRNELGNAT